MRMASGKWLLKKIAAEKHVFFRGGLKNLLVSPEI
jgi:hypothetical protein